MLLNKTPIQWYSKSHNTVETSTYGSELVAMRIATELTMAMCYKIRMLGVPIDFRLLITFLEFLSSHPNINRN